MLVQGSGTALAREAATGAAAALALLPRGPSLLPKVALGGNKI